MIRAIPVWMLSDRSVTSRRIKTGGRLAITTDINRGEGSFLFHQPNFDGLIGNALGFKTGKIP
ncbi:unnamed protein product, partial [marine sediment metagenome]